MGLLSNTNGTLIVSSARILLIVVSVAAVFAACSDPAPASSPSLADTPTPVTDATPASVPSPSAQAAEQWPAAPRPTPTPGAMLVLPTPEPSTLADEVYAVLNTLTTQYSPRESGTAQEEGAAQYLQENLDALGYDTLLQEFDTPHLIWAEIQLTSDEGEPLMDSGHSHLHPGAVTFSGDSATGLLTLVGEVLEKDIPDEGLEGKIALIEPGTSTLVEQVDRLMNASAEGAIVLTEEDLPFDALPYDYPAIPVISLYSGGSHGPQLLKLIEQGDITASITVINRKLFSQNVVATMRKRADDEPRRQVILGAHYDTVEDTQGASDNGSGVSALMTVARHIAERDYSFDIRIILFGAEEFGLFGSEHYVEGMGRDEIDGTIVMLNFDALGSGNTLHAIGDFDLVTKAIEIGRELGAPIALEGTRGASSDHAPFAEVGIPALFLSSNDISRINAPEDTIEHINPDLLGYAAEVAIAMLDSLAQEAR